MTTKREVITAHRAHPEWSPSDIAIHLGCSTEYVRATAQRNQLKLPRAVRSHNTRIIYISKAQKAALDGPAIERGMTVADLARTILSTVAQHNLVDAILDDADERGIA